MIQSSVVHRKMFVGGGWVDSVDGGCFEVEGPAKKGSILATVPRAGSRDVDISVQAASRAFGEWRKVSHKRRGEALFKIASYLEDNLEEFARINSIETGSPIRTQSRREILSAAEIFRYFGALVGELKGSTRPVDDGVLLYTQREPYGVVGAIVPFNDPMVLSAVKIAPAIGAGNTIVLKAPEDAPLGILRLCEAFEKYLPPGVVNILTGYGEECGRPLVDHPLVRKIAFTGSTEVGKLVMHCAADRIVPVSLELGGKSPQIVCADSDSDETANGVIEGIRFSRQGQSCSAGTRLYVHASIYDSFISKLLEKVQKLSIGDPLDENSCIGAINNERQFKKVCDFIASGLQDGDVKLLCGGLPPPDGSLSTGYYIQPTLFGCSNGNVKLAKEEIFGPVMMVIPWESVDEVIASANNSRYGLAAYVWTKNIDLALEIANRLEAGWVQVNSGHGPRAGVPFGGYKESGIGREFSLESMIDGYSQLKSIEIKFRHD